MKIEKQFHFLSGIGRSGSTVLAALLSQNPRIHATATSPLLDMLVLSERAWREQVTQSKTRVVDNQLDNIYKGIINGVWSHMDKPVIIDKHRAWPRNTPGIKQMMGIKNPKIICTVRDVASCVASFMRLIEQSPGSVSAVDDILIKRGLPLTTSYRCDVIWNDFLQNVYESLWIGWNQCRESILLVEYDDLTTRPQQQLERIYEFLEMDSFQGHDLERIENVEVENDIFWGFDGLHDVRSVLAKTARPPAEIIGAENAKRFSMMEFWRGGDFNLAPSAMPIEHMQSYAKPKSDFWMGSKPASRQFIAPAGPISTRLAGGSVGAFRTPAANIAGGWGKPKQNSFPIINSKGSVV
jgi:sulfotransferase